MSRKIAILRGINVGGHRKILMADLRTLMSQLGFKEVATYIQSGNIIFDNPGESSNSKIAETIKEGIASQFGFEVPVIVFDQEMLQKAVSRNPFYTEGCDSSKLHLTVLSQKPIAEALVNLETFNAKPDQFQIIENYVYLYIENKYHTSKLANSFFEKNLKVTATTRNWKTVLKLLEISSQ